MFVVLFAGPKCQNGDTRRRRRLLEAHEKGVKRVCVPNRSTKSAEQKREQGQK